VLFVAAAAAADRLSAVGGRCEHFLGVSPPGQRTSARTGSVASSSQPSQPQQLWTPPLLLGVLTTACKRTALLLSEYHLRHISILIGDLD
jgi:hypothetical protein